MKRYAPSRWCPYSGSGGKGCWLLSSSYAVPGVDMEDLARRMSQLEERAFDQFIAYFGPRLRTFYLHRGMSPADAEDLAATAVTDIALKVETKYKCHETGGGFAAWVFTVAAHMKADWHRRHPQGSTLALVEAHTTDLPLQADAFGDSSDSAEEESLVVSTVQDVLSQFSEADQLLIRMRHLEVPAPFEEIAALLCIRAGAARTRHLRLLKRLEVILRDDPRLSRLVTNDVRF